MIIESNPSATPSEIFTNSSVNTESGSILLTAITPFLGLWPAYNGSSP